ncbi:alpha/beta hydrolase [candidate division KSB1 bacterium]|nr:alpha/beta hydrolase [candidate division KSB1 bacterium]
MIFSKPSFKNGLLTGIILILLLSGGLYAQEDIILGKRMTITSKVLGEDRDVFISTPRNYEGSTERYPVLYVLDGERNFQFSSTIADYLSARNLMSQMIVVGIPNTDRTRDFTPTADKDRQNSGGADKFIQFTKTELIPYVDNNYRTHPYRVLVGHSLCGMFSVYTLFTNPDLFQAHVAISPYLMYDDQVVLKQAAAALEANPSFKQTLFITLGNEPNYVETLKSFTELLTRKAPDMHWEYKVYQNDNHGSVPLKSVYDGLSFIYSDWQVSNDVVEKGLDAIKAHFARLSKKYGYEQKPSEVFINAQGYRLMGNNNMKLALELFHWNVKNYPESANVYDSLGEALEQNEQYDEALKNYNVAVEKGNARNDPNTPIYKQHMDRVKQKPGNTM